MAAPTDASSSTNDGIASQLAEMFEMMTRLSSDLHTTNKVLADTRADQVALRAAVREFTGTNGNESPHKDKNKKFKDDGEDKPHIPRDHGPKIRIDPPRFNGDNTEDWIDRIETYFDYHDTPPTERLYLVRMLMDPPASAWFRYYRANNCDSSWDEFLRAVRHRFDPDYYVDYLGVLSNLKQTTSVQQYQAAFESNLTKVSGTTERTLISLFIAGLKQPMQRELNIRRPTTLAAVFALARELEACHQEVLAAVPTPQRRQPATQAAQMLPAPINRATATHPATNLPVVRLSAAERAERQRLGLCFYCPEKWVTGHRCTGKFLAFMSNEDDDFIHPEILILPTPEFPPVTMPEPPVITADVSSIHSLAGTSNPRSLRFVGFINATPVQVLLDGGSTHNFIHPTIAEKLRLPLTSITPFRVYVGNGDSLFCSSLCTNTSILLQGHTFEIDLFVLAIHGPDIVLGVQWLQTLGQVTHNYADLTVQFQWNDKLVTFQGTGS